MVRETWPHKLKSDSNTSNILDYLDTFFSNLLTEKTMTHYNLL
jgi:hypothetical protein